MKKRTITNAHAINVFLHCGLCLQQLPKDESPKSYQRLSIGYTPLGLQVWCVRHECNVMHVDFQGQQHPANTTRNAKKKAGAN